jgi:hypothetical protein
MEFGDRFRVFGQRDAPHLVKISGSISLAVFSESRSDRFHKRGLPPLASR